jgi:hypothetical protein
LNLVFCSAQNLNDETGAHKTSNYRNLFKEKNYAEKEIDAKVEKACQQCFIAAENSKSGNQNKKNR